jgi:hypothetical protein
VTCFAVYGDVLIAGGSFASIAGQTSKGLARWDGASWQPFAGLDRSAGSLTVSSLAVANGELVVSGNFDHAGGAPVGTLVAWNGSSWRALGAGTNVAAYSMVELGGVLHLGGSFTTCAGGLSCYHARWVDGARPAIIRMPRPAMASPGESRSFLVEVSDATGATYQWSRDGQVLADGPTPSGSIIGGAATSQLTVAGIAGADAGSYSCAVTNPCGVTTSLGAALTVGFVCGSADFNHDGDTATDSDIECFFACLAGNCCSSCDSADFNGDGDVATDADIEAFFRVLAGGNC